MLEEIAHQAQVEKVLVITQLEMHFKISLKDRSMTNLQSNVIIERNLGIIQMNVESSNMILDKKLQTLPKKTKLKIACS